MTCLDHQYLPVFVVELEELKVVGVASLGVGGGDGGLDLLDNIVVLGELLALLVSLTLGDTGLKYTIIIGQKLKYPDLIGLEIQFCALSLELEY